MNGLTSCRVWTHGLLALGVLLAGVGRLVSISRVGLPKPAAVWLGCLVPELVLPFVIAVAHLRQSLSDRSGQWLQRHAHQVRLRHDLAGCASPSHILDLIAILAVPRISGNGWSPNRVVGKPGKYPPATAGGLGFGVAAKVAFARFQNRGGCFRDDRKAQSTMDHGRLYWGRWLWSSF